MPLPALGRQPLPPRLPRLRGRDRRRGRPRRRRRGHPHGDDLHPAAPGAAGPRHRRGAPGRLLGRRHPPDARRRGAAWRSVEELVALAAHPKFVGIGETGLDYHYTADSAALQAESLRVHIEAAARATGLPLIVHARDADADIGAHPRRGACRGRLRLRHALLHLRARAGRDRARPRLLPLDLRHRDLPQRRRACAPSSPTRRATGCWSRPTAPTSRRSRTAASATSRPTSPTPPAPMAAHLGMDAGRVRGADLGQLRPAVRHGPPA